MKDFSWWQGSALWLQCQERAVGRCQVEAGCQVGLSSLLRCEKKAMATCNSSFGALVQNLFKGIREGSKAWGSSILLNQRHGTFLVTVGSWVSWFCRFSSGSLGKVPLCLLIPVWAVYGFLSIYAQAIHSYWVKHFQERVGLPCRKGFKTKVVKSLTGRGGELGYFLSLMVSYWPGLIVYWNSYQYRYGRRNDFSVTILTMTFYIGS